MTGSETLLVPEKQKLSRTKSDRRYERRRKNSPLTRLGVDPRQLIAAPKISPILREIPGGKRLALKAMRFSETECIQKFLAKYDSISPHDREKLNIESIALAASLDIRHLWGEIMLAMREHSVNSVKVIAVASHPDVIKRSVEYAQLPGGYRDREHIHTMLGALPTPKNQSIFINKVFTGTPKEESEPEKPEELTDDLEWMFPDASAIQERSAMARQKLLEPGK